MPVSLDIAKQHLNPDHDDDDNLIELYIKAATASAENFCGRAFIERTLDFYADQFPATSAKWLEIPFPPLIVVGGVFYRDGAGVEQEFAAASYNVDVVKEPARLSLVYGGSWPTIAGQPNAVRVRYTAGYSDDQSPPGENVPADIKAAILMTVGTLYEHRETIIVGQIVNLMPWAAEQLLRQYRVENALA